MSAVAIECVSRRGGSQEVVRPTATSQLKMENACIFCNVMETS
jgi:hypothetical protein